MNFEVLHVFLSISYFFSLHFIFRVRRLVLQPLEKRVACELRIAVPGMSEELGQRASVDL
jgi:hypothetical protein